MKKLLYKIGFAICVIAFMVICCLMAYQYKIRSYADKRIEAMQENAQADYPDTESEIKEATTAPTSTSEPTPTQITETPLPPSPTEAVDILTARGITIPEKNIDWDQLRSENEDIYAWIYIPGTNVDYPIVQHPDIKSYYLTHNYDHSEGYPGCIYVQNVNKKDWSDPNTVIYGHNMNNGSMFNTLHYFEDAVFFDEHQFIYIYTPEANKVYEVFASYPFSDDDLMVCFDYSTPDALLGYFNSIWTNRSMTSHFRESVVLDENSRIISLSTCIGGEPEMRYLVQAVLLNP